LTREALNGHVAHHLQASTDSRLTGNRHGFPTGAAGDLLRFVAVSERIAELRLAHVLHDEHQLIADMVKAQLAMPESGFLDSRPMAATERRQAIALR
jgi:hypothetical protein